MVNAKEAAALAQKYVENFIAECDCANHEDIAHVLTTLASTCGHALCWSAGQEAAVSCLLRVVDHIDSQEIAELCKIERAH